MSYTFLPNGSVLQGMMEVRESEGWTYYETGPLGERIPVKPGNVTLYGTCDPCVYTSQGSGISYPRGNYTITWVSPVRENHVQFAYDVPYNVTVVLPKELNVKSPFLGLISQGGVAKDHADNTTHVTWNETRSIELRFYDKGRESLLLLFGQIWVVLAVVLLLPFVITMRRKE